MILSPRRAVKSYQLAKKDFFPLIEKKKKSLIPKTEFKIAIPTILFPSVRTSCLIMEDTQVIYGCQVGRRCQGRKERILIILRVDKNKTKTNKKQQQKTEEEHLLDKNTRLINKD